MNCVDLRGIVFRMMRNFVDDLAIFWADIFSHQLARKSTQPTSAPPTATTTTTAATSIASAKHEGDASIVSERRTESVTLGSPNQPTGGRWAEKRGGGRSRERRDGGVSFAVSSSALIPGV